ncbi:hypothetical protein T06_9327 [Trichinella sp. T6]|nr:hypothetical protein T06_9327 [Trichinella sp. T6]
MCEPVFRIRGEKGRFREIAHREIIALSTVSNIRISEAQILSQLDDSLSKSRCRRMRKTVNAEKFQFFVRCRAKWIPISGQLLQTNAIDIARKMGIKQWLAGIICVSKQVEPSIIELNVYEWTKETADQILIEELLSKSNVNKDVLSEKVEDPLKEKLTYSKAITIKFKSSKFKNIKFKSTLI